MRSNDRQVPSSMALHSVNPGQQPAPSAGSNRRQPEKWGWGYAIVVMITVSAACWLGLGAIILL